MLFSIYYILYKSDIVKYRIVYENVCDHDNTHKKIIHIYVSNQIQKVKSLNIIT